jgi:O-antigen/teichoic acid export membrane protein
MFSPTAKKVIGTVGIRYVAAAFNLALIFVNAKILGVSGMGLAGVIYASANIVMIVNGILGGNTIVYFMNRVDFRYVFWPAYIWALIGSTLSCGAMKIMGVLPIGYAIDVYVLSLLLSFVTVHTRILLGKDHIRGFNVTFLIQGLLFFSIIYIYYIVGMTNVRGYLWGMYATNGLAWLVSLVFMSPYFLRQHNDRQLIPKSITKFLKEMFVYGLWSSADNLAEGLTARLNYFLIQRLGGFGQVGLLDAGTKISESVWHISRSVSFISYSQVAKTFDAEEQRSMTIRFFRLTFCAIALVMGIVLLIPEWVYTDYLFSAEFAGIRKVITGLAIGIIALGSNSIFSHYFIGTGKVRYSTACSCIGLVVLLISGYFLIPAYGVFGAACSSSIAFSAMLTFSFIVFIRQTGTKIRDFIFIRPFIG